MTAWRKMALATTLMCGAVGIDAVAALVRGPYLQRVSSDEITLCWRSSTSHTGTVFVGTSEMALTNSYVEMQADINHAVRLTGLEPDTTYHYQINDGTNVLAGGTDHFFQTAPLPGSESPRRIWVLGDSGTADANAGDVYSAYTNFNGSQYTDLMLMLGDNAYSSGTDEEYQRAVFDMYPEILRQTPWFSCFSNHDGSSADSATQTGPYYEIFTLPAAGECGGVPSGTEAYYSFDFGNIHFVCLDSFETPRGTNDTMHAWLEQDLAATTSDWLIAFWHHPPYTKGSHDSDTEDGLVDMRENFLPLLEGAGVDLVMAGHSHLYERSYLIHDHYGDSSTFHLPYHAADAGDGKEAGGGVYEKASSGSYAGKGAVYMVAGSSGWVSGIQPDYPHPAMSTSQRQLGSVVLDVAGTRLDATFLDSAGVVRDSFSILKVEVGAGDSDGDGLPDDWEQFHFGDPTNAVAIDDADADGLDNLSEYIAGTYPQDPVSVLALDASVQSNGNVVVRWPSSTDRNYAMWRSMNLVSNDWMIIASNLAATVPVNELAFPTETNAAFYRVDVRLDP